MIGLKTLIPKEFRPFLKYIGPSAFDVIEWKKSLKPIGQISSRYFTNDGVENLIKTYQAYKPQDLKLVNENLGDIKVQPNELGEMILKIYFSQLENPNGSFLDLKKDNFFLKDNYISWQPNGLWHKWDNHFREGLLYVYKGFYDSQNALMQQGLEKMSLVHSDMKESTKKEIIDLLVSHVGSESPTNVKFSLEIFEKSFEDFFKILKSEKIRLPADFLFLGIYLVSLYSNLEKIDLPFNVQKAYLEKNQ